jgi:peptide/nickel transport system substrate-binding protein
VNGTINRRRALQGAGLLGLTAALAACGGGGGLLPSSSQTVGNTDINPRPRDQVRDGGDLRLPIGGLSPNYNNVQVDGSSVDVINISRATLPYPFIGTADGELRLNPDFLVSAEVTSPEPQVVTYTINPKATWSDGTPITWRDFEAYWRSCNGSDPAYQVAGTTGYSDISSVARGADDRQAVVTFRQRFAEWKALFDPFLPASLTGSADSFNTAWKDTITVTAGPFTLDSIDRTGQIVTLKRDPRWWGVPAKLDRIIYRTVDPAAEADALANNEIDYYEIASSQNLIRRARATAGAVVRNAPSRQVNTLTLNGAPGALLADPELRRAVGQGLDVPALTERMIQLIVPGAHRAGSHIYPAGTREYQDNSGAVTFDPAQANRALDQLGWIRAGATRQKDGRPLSLRMIYFNADTNLAIVKTIQNQLAQIGVTVVPDVRSGTEISPSIYRGDFDLAVIIWQNTPTPLSSGVGIYQTPTGANVRQNYGRIASPRIDAMFAQAISELDDAKRADLGNQIDRLIWQEVHSIPLYARPGAVAVRSNLVNFGAAGFADIDYINAGFMA